MKNTKSAEAKTQSNKQKFEQKNNTKGCCNFKQQKSPIDFYICIMSITAIFALLLIYLVDKKERIDFVKSGLIQKVENDKIIWVKP